MRLAANHEHGTVVTMQTYVLSTETVEIKGKESYVLHTTDFGRLITALPSIKDKLHTLSGKNCQVTVEARRKGETYVTRSGEEKPHERDSWNITDAVAIEGNKALVAMLKEAQDLGLQGDAFGALASMRNMDAQLQFQTNQAAMANIMATPAAPPAPATTPATPATEQPAVVQEQTPAPTVVAGETPDPLKP